MSASTSAQVAAGRTPRAGARRGPTLAAPLLLFALLAGLCWWYLGQTPLDSGKVLFFGAAPSSLLTGFHGAETDAEGHGMRWSDGAATVELPALGPGTHLLSLAMSAPRPVAAEVPVTLSLNGLPLASFVQGPGVRHATLLAPAAVVQRGQNVLGITSATFTPGAGDRRELGVAVFALRWRSIAPTGWLVPAQAASIGAAAALFALLLRRADIPLAAGLLAVALFVAILISMRHSDPRFLQRWYALLLSGGLGLTAGAALTVIRPQPGDGQLLWRAWASRHWPALAGYTALTALMFLPMLAGIATAIPGHPGDAFEYLWKLQLFSDHLIDRHQSPAFVPELMYPTGFELAASEMTPANTLLGLPVTWLFGPIVSFNTLNLASYVLTGFFSYLLIERLGARRLAAFVGAIAFTFTVRRFFQMSAGHLPLMPTQYLPLALYGLEGLLTRRRHWDAFVAALGLTLATWASLYYGTTLALFMAAYALLRGGLSLAWVREAWRPLVLGAVLLTALVAPFAQPYLEIRGQGSELRHALIHLEVHAAHPADYLLPNPNHPLFGAWARQFQRNDGGEHVVALGYSVIALLAIGLALARPRRLALALGLLMAITFVLTLGPFLDLPGGGRFPLPVLFIYEHVPILDGIRVWNRVVLYIALSAAILIGLSLTRLRGRRYYIAAALAAALMLFELAAVSRFTAAGPRPVDRWLAAQPDSGAAFELPVPLSGSDVFYASFQGRPSSVWYGTFDPPLYAESQEILRGFPSSRSVQLLMRWGVRYLILDEAALSAIAPGWQAETARLLGPSPAYSEGGFSVYRLGPGSGK